MHRDMKTDNIPLVAICIGMLAGIAWEAPLLRILAIAMFCVLLTGCGSLDLQNRVGCSLDRTQGIFVSWYGPVGVAAKIDSKDAAAMCGAKP